ncbi:MAG TPA: hypothetical protein VFK86_14810 [Bauldia sp.]|nr:hypothetical protein [Bauldia sp.]
MCGACGILGGGPDWLDRVDNPAGVPHGSGLTLVAERQRRVALVNLLLETKALRLREFGRRMVVAAPTGGAEIVDDLRHVWMQADRMADGGVDPLDTRVIDRLAGGRV